MRTKNYQLQTTDYKLPTTKYSRFTQEMVTNRTLLVGPDGKMRKQLLVMDEVDGMSGECMRRRVLSSSA